MYTLVVIDLQPGFIAGNKSRVRENALREIKRAVKDEADIVFLEFLGHGSTHRHLMEVVQSYKRCQIKTKQQDDGSSQVYEAVRDHGFMIGRFRVVGINTDFCVYSTVEGLRRRFPNSFIEVVSRACDSHNSHRKGLNKIRKLENIDIVPE